MTGKILNVIIVVSIIGLGIITIRDIFFPKPSSTFPVKTSNLVATPTIEMTRTPLQATLIPCSQTFIGNIPHTVLRYKSETKNSIAIGTEASEEAKLVVERFEMQLEKKTDMTYSFVTVAKEEQQLTLECTSGGINAELFGNKFLLLPSEEIKKGAIWTSPFFLDVPLGFGSLSDFDFTYTIEDVETKNILGSNREVAVVNITADELEAAQYSVASGLGIVNVTILIDLENFGAYSKNLKLESVQ